MGNVGTANPLHTSVEKPGKKPFHAESDPFKHDRGIARVGVCVPGVTRRIPKLKPARELAPPQTLSTTLPCGLTVATRETYETVSITVFG